MILRLTIILSTFFTTLSFACISQTNSIPIDTTYNSSGVNKLFLAKSKSEAKEIGRVDAKRGSLFLCIKGGIAPITSSKEDLRFARKYNLNYYDFGCTGPMDSLVNSYNFEIIDYCVQTYGLKWLLDVRKDVCGIELWKRQ